MLHKFELDWNSVPTYLRGGYKTFECHKLKYDAVSYGWNIKTIGRGNFQISSEMNLSFDAFDF